MLNDKKSMRLTLLLVCAIAIAMIGAISFAYFTVRIEDEGDVNSLKGKAVFTDYKISLSETNTGLSLENTYPMPDEVGLRQSPYTFTVKNEETSRGVGISIIIEVISTSTLSDDLVHVSIEEEVKSLSMNNAETPSETTYRSAYKIHDFDLAPGASKTYNLRTWINSSGTVNNAQNKTWSARVLVVPGISASGKTLEALHLNSKGVLTTGFDNPASTTADIGIYELTDEGDMTSYYFRGPVENNYVRFGKWRDDEPNVYVGRDSNGYAKEFTSLTSCNADSQFNRNCTLVSRAGKDMYWRIIRINGDGSLRMIYAGTSAHVNYDQGDDTFIKLGQQFNPFYDDAKYVGYMYGPPNAVEGTTTPSTSEEQAQTNTVSSDMKIVLEEWYAKNLLNDYDKHISKDAIFCNDRSTPGKDVTGWSDDTGEGFGTNNVGYGAASRAAAWNSSTTASMPTFKCPQENDKFTAKEAATGNKTLEYPIGLITIDDLLAAGSGKFNTTSDYYLKRNSWYWTLSPADYSGASFTFLIYENGKLANFGTEASLDVAPVINLTAEYARTLKGTGIIGDEFQA